MNKREIVIEALKRRPAPVVPHNIDLTIAMRDKLRVHFGLDTPEQVGERLGNYCVQLNIGSVSGTSEGIIREIYPKQVAEHTYVDDWGVIWRREPGDDIGVVIGPALKEADLKGFTPPTPISRAPYLAEFCKRNPDRFRLVSMSSPLFQRAWFLRGFENFMVDMALDPPFVHELMDSIMVYTTAVVREALSFDIDGLLLMDDWGQQEGLLMSPAMWREYIKPRMKTLFDMIHSAGKFAFLHSCGDVQTLIPDLIEIGVEVLNPFQPEVMNVYRLKEEFGDRICFYGGVSTQELLPHGTVDDVKRDVRDKIARIGANGGYLLAPAHAIQADVPIGNVLALVDALEEQRSPERTTAGYSTDNRQPSTDNR